MNFHRLKKKRIERYGIVFDNDAELARYEYLLLEVRAGEIVSQPDGPAIQVHPEFPIIVNGQRVATMVLDFAYVHRQRGPQYEDCKPTYNKKKKQVRGGVVVREWKERAPWLEPEYILKKKIVQALYEITITEIWKR